MGYQLERFIGNVDELLICLICRGVVQNPMQCTICEHPFCQSCISSWISNSSTCPANHHHMLMEHVVCVPRILRNLLDRLKIKCAFAENGCQAQLALENLRAHEASCEKNPNGMVTCNEGCGMLVPRVELEQHTCLSMLRALMEQQRNQIQQLQLQLSVQEKVMNIHNNELENVHHFIYCLRRTSPRLNNIANNWDSFCLTEWGLNLPVALVRNWDHLISRPNCFMMSVLKDSLRKQGCPMQAIDDVVDSSLEINAFDFIHGYRLRLLQPLRSGKQCVLMLGDENRHMPVNLMRLGLIMVFEDGVERAVDNAVTNEENDESDGTDTESGGIDGGNDGAWGPTRPQMMSLPIDAYRERDNRVSDPRGASNDVDTLQASGFNAGFEAVSPLENNTNAAQTPVTPINGDNWGLLMSISRLFNNFVVANGPSEGNGNCGTTVSELERPSRLTQNALLQPTSSERQMVTNTEGAPTNTNASLNAVNDEQLGDDSGNNGNNDDVV